MGEKAFAERLVSAMSQMTNPTKDRMAQVPTKSGGKYTYMYTQLPDVLGVIRPPLLENGILLLQGVRKNGDSSYDLVCQVTDGETTMVLDTRRFAPTGDPQSQGSYETYMRRYQLLTSFGLSGDDDDGEDASRQRRGQQPARQPQQQVQQQVQQTPWQAMVNLFYAKCEQLGYDPNEMWDSMVTDLNIPVTETSPRQNIDAAMGWINRLQ